MTPKDKWRTLYIIAGEDREAFRLLVNAPGISLGIASFHAQQAVEKYLKAVLRNRNIDYPYTHDLAYLMELLENNGFSLPFPIEQAEKLNPFAIQIRYDLPAVIPVERHEIEEIVDLVAEWCQKQLHD